MYIIDLQYFFMARVVKVNGRGEDLSVWDGSYNAFIFSLITYFYKCYFSQTSHLNLGSNILTCSSI